MMSETNKRPTAIYCSRLKSALRAQAAAALFAAMLLSCSGSGKSDAEVDDVAAPGEVTAVEPATPGSDLWVMELRGPVKECVSTVYYNVDFDEHTGEAIPDTIDIATHTRNLYFDRAGRYLASADERIRRDGDGRITGWRDARPNNRPTHPGVLADTLAYTYLDGNVLASQGMGEYAVTVYDDEGRIAGQYARPDVVESAHTAAFNIYRATDEAGNWTERLTVWVSRGPQSRPHITYTLERRDIKYYKM